VFPKYPHEKSTKLVWRGPQLSELGTASMVTNLKNQQGKQTSFFQIPVIHSPCLSPRNQETVNQTVVTGSYYRAVSSQKRRRKKNTSKIGLVGCSSGDRLLISLYTKIYVIHSWPSDATVGLAGGWSGWTVGGGSTAANQSFRSAGPRSVGGGGGGGAAAGAEVGDAVHALVHRRVGAEAGLDAVLARRVAPAGHRVQAPALRRDRLGAPAAVFAARPCPRRRLPPAR
jgi:hypothetical protein